MGVYLKYENRSNWTRKNPKQPVHPVQEKLHSCLPQAWNFADFKSKKNVAMASFLLQKREKETLCVQEKVSSAQNIHN